MNFNTNFGRCCCRPQQNCCWQNPCRPMPRPPKCGCGWQNHCGCCNPCCNDRRWDDRGRDWDKNDFGRFNDGFEERNFQGSVNFPDDFGQKNEQFDRFDDFDKFDDFGGQFNRVERRGCGCNQGCRNNCSCNRNALCLLAGCFFGKCCCRR